MKNLMRLGMMALLVATFSCNETKKSENLNVNDLAFSTVANTTEVATSPCFSSDKINGDTYYFWSQSWLTAFANLLGSRHGFTTSPRFPFDRQMINDYMVSDAENPGIIIYYIRPQGSPTPALAMLKTDGCRIIDTGSSDTPIGLYYWNGTWKIWSNDKRPIPSGDMNIATMYEMLDSWEDYMAGLKYPNVPIKGYYYSWESIRKIINGDNPQDLTIALGLRTISPQEVSEFYSDGSPTNDDGSLRAGLPVLVNMLLEVKPTSDTDTDTDTVQYQDFDFAKPCPHFCNETN